MKRIGRMGEAQRAHQPGALMGTLRFAHPTEMSR